MKYSIISLFLIYFGICGSTIQEDLTNHLDYEVNSVRPPLSMEKETLNKANTLMDLNKHYKASWIREYISVEISATHNGQTIKESSKSHNISKAQKNIMQKADVGSEIEVKVQYIPENTLKNNEAKQTDFAFIVNPENEAKYPTGAQKMEQYLLKNAIGKIPNEIFKEYDLAAIKFTVTQKGEITNVHIFESSKDEKIDQLLLKTISDMPNWKPAEYANGTKVRQDFVLTVGNHRSCIINTLNIGRLSFEDRN